MAEKKYTESQEHKLLEQIQCYTNAKGYTEGKMATILGIATGSWSDLLNGKYCGDKEGHLTKIEQFLDREADRAERAGQIKFTPTTVSKDIFKILRLNHVHGTMGGTIADSGVGKTAAFRQYALQNEGVIYLSASKWVVTHVQLSKKLGDILLRKAPRSNQDRCEAIIDKLLGSSRLLIIDQAHQLNDGAHEFLQNLWDHCNPSEDERRLGIVLGCTWRFWQEVNNPKGIYLYEQLLRRMNAGYNKVIDRKNVVYSIDDIRNIFAPENLRFRLSDAGYAYLHKRANGPGSLGQAIADLEHLQELLAKRKVPAATEMTVQLLEQTQQLMLPRRAA